MNHNKTVHKMTVPCLYTYSQKERKREREKERKREREKERKREREKERKREREKERKREREKERKREREKERKREMELCFCGTLEPNASALGMRSSACDKSEGKQG